MLVYENNTIYAYYIIEYSSVYTAWSKAYFIRQSDAWISAEHHSSQGEKTPLETLEKDKSLTRIPFRLYNWQTLLRYDLIWS